MNSQKYKKEVYPDDFNEDDKLEFDLLLEQSKIMFPKLASEEWLIRTGVIAFLRKKKEKTKKKRPMAPNIQRTAPACSRMPSAPAAAVSLLLSRLTVPGRPWPFF